MPSSPYRLLRWGASISPPVLLLLPCCPGLLQTCPHVLSDSHPQLQDSSVDGGVVDDGYDKDRDRQEGSQLARPGSLSSPHYGPKGTTYTKGLQRMDATRNINVTGDWKPSAASQAARSVTVPIKNPSPESSYQPLPALRLALLGTPTWTGGMPAWRAELNPFPSLILLQRRRPALCLAAFIVCWPGCCSTTCRCDS